MCAPIISCLVLEYYDYVNLDYIANGLVVCPINSFHILPSRKLKHHVIRCVAASRALNPRGQYEQITKQKAENVGYCEFNSAHLVKMQAMLIHNTVCSIPQYSAFLSTLIGANHVWVQNVPIVSK